MSLVYIYVALALFNVEYLTLPMASIENIVDEAANIAVLDSKGRIKRKGKGAHEKQVVVHDVDMIAGGLDWRTFWSEGTDAVMDVPVGGVCEILYGEGKWFWNFVTCLGTDSCAGSDMPLGNMDIAPP